MAEQQEQYKEKDGVVLVPLVLAHPFAKAYAERVRAETVKDYKVGDTIWVSREYGNALIEAGQIQVDPEDTESRQKALLLNKRNQPLAGDELAAVPAPAQPQMSPLDAPSAETKPAAKK